VCVGGVVCFAIVFMVCDSSIVQAYQHTDTLMPELV
jgi:hypothetical protein